MTQRQWLGAPPVVALLLLTLGGIFIYAQVSAVQKAEGVSSASKVEPRVMAATESGQNTSFLVLLSDQADLRAAYSIQDQDARGWYVYRTLTEHAARTQAGLRRFLDASGVKYKSFWVANAILCEGGRDLVNALAVRDDVRAIEANHPSLWVQRPKIKSVAIASPNDIEWNVENVRAPDVWALGFTGQGTVIGNADTGMQWDHPALQPHYRGWNGSSADHNYNWHDAIHDSVGNPCGNDSPFPCDDIGHGTHTTGITSGDDGQGNQIGVAPGAQWIGCRNMDQGNGTPARYTECFQFFIAPTDLNGNNPDPALRPHVINNSWTCPPSEGCAPTTLQTIVENTQAAGIFVEASAGNTGPACSSISDPAAIYAASFTTGAYDIGNNLADFSSRGPVTSDGSGRMKPDISAPGVDVRSSFPTNTYAVLSGTSMAGPHVVGAVALLWSAEPSLARQIDQTKSVLTGSANPNVLVSAETCGGIPSSQIPNNSFGWGALDAYAATQATFTLTVSPSSQSVIQGNSTTYTAAVSPLNGSSGDVTLSVTGLPSGTTGNFSPNPITGGSGSSTLMVTVGAFTAPGTYTLIITGTDGTYSPGAAVTLIVTTASGGALSPTTVSFGSVVIGTTSAAKKVLLTSNGGAPLAISNISFTGTNSSDFAQTNNCPGSLNVGAKCTINVTFTPSIQGTETATLNVNDNAANSPQTAALSGMGISPATLTPVSGAYGNVPINTASSPKTFTLKNNQAVPLNISSIAFMGSNAGDFSETTTCGNSLAAKASCTIRVTFTPTTLGAEIAMLTVSEDAPAPYNFLTALLTGTGIAQATVSPSSLTFPKQTVGTTSAAKNVTLTNNLTTALAITSITFAGANAGDFAETDTCDGSLAAKSHCTISVTFKPTATGTRTATLNVNDSANNTPQQVSLTGTGK